MRQIQFSRPATLLCLSALLGTVVSAQVCPDTVEGTYSYSALGNGVAGSLLAGTGTSTSTTGSTTGTGSTTTTTTSAFSNTELGLLLGGVAGTAPFSTAGTLYFDGSGNIRASSTNQGGMATLVGTYVVNSDCTITVTLMDAFGTNKPTSASTLQGVVLSNGSEIDLGVLQNTSTTSGTGTGTGTGTATTSSSGLYASNILITLVRSFAPFCSAGNLTGAYALVGEGTRVTSVVPSSSSGTGTGTTTTPTQTQAPFYLFGIVQFDGNGNILSQAGSQSPLSYLRFAGMYTVNPDCTGTMTLGSVPATGTTTTGTSTTPNSTMAVSFVLTPPTASAGMTNASGSRPGIEFSVSNGTQDLFGYGRPQ